MPLYEFACRACGERFESLVRAGDRAAGCPACSGTDVERLLSSFGVKTDATTKSAFTKAKEAQRKVGRDEAIAERERAESHHH